LTCFFRSFHRRRRRASTGCLPLLANLSPRQTGALRGDCCVKCCARIPSPLLRRATPILFFLLRRGAPILSTFRHFSDLCSSDFSVQTEKGSFGLLLAACSGGRVEIMRRFFGTLSYHPVAFTVVNTKYITRWKHFPPFLLPRVITYKPRHHAKQTTRHPAEALAVKAARPLSISRRWHVRLSLSFDGAFACDDLVKGAGLKGYATSDVDTRLSPLFAPPCYEACFFSSSKVARHSASLSCKSSGWF